MGKLNREPNWIMNWLNRYIHSKLLPVTTIQFLSWIWHPQMEKKNQNLLKVIKSRALCHLCELHLWFCSLLSEESPTDHDSPFSLYFILLSISWFHLCYWFHKQYLWKNGDLAMVGWCVCVCVNLNKTWGEVTESKITLSISEHNYLNSYLSNINVIFFHS